MVPCPPYDETFFSVMDGIPIIKQLLSRITLKQGTDHEEPKMKFGAGLFQDAWRPFSEEAWIIGIR